MSYCTEQQWLKETGRDCRNEGGGVAGYCLMHQN